MINTKCTTSATMEQVQHYLILLTTTDFRVTHILLHYLFYFNILSRDRSHGLIGNICGFMLLRSSLALLQQSSQLLALDES